MTLPTAYNNGRFLPLAEVAISPLDRGFLFADGVYEVIPVYAGKLFLLEAHLERLSRSLDAVAIQLDPPPDWQALLGELVTRNGGGDQYVYLQITRGSAPVRDHRFPADTPPTLFAMASPLPDTRAARQGVAAVTRSDNRWDRCDIKSIALLPNVLLRQAAEQAGAAETILLREGRLTEASASNVFIVRDGALVTPPKSPHMLAGITRDFVLELAASTGIPTMQATVSEEELRTADEVWLTSSTREVTPVIRLDGKPVGGGEPGPVWGVIRAAFDQAKQAFTQNTATL